MKNYALLTDSTANLSKELAEEHDIYLTPYLVTIDNESYLDGVDITKDQMYERMEREADFKTAVPSPSVVHLILEKIRDQGYSQVLALTSALEVTGMYNLLQLVKDQVEGLEVHVLDTGGIGMATGVQVLYANQLRQQGQSLEEVVRALEAAEGKGNIYAAVGRLDYMIQGGRLSPIKGRIGKLLRINPILFLKEKKVDLNQMVRGKKNLNRALRSLFQEEKAKNPGKSYVLGLFYGNNLESFRGLKEEFAEDIKAASLYIEEQVTSVLAVHSGPDVVGFGYVFYEG